MTAEHAGPRARRRRDVPTPEGGPKERIRRIRDDVERRTRDSSSTARCADGRAEGDTWSEWNAGPNPPRFGSEQAWPGSLRCSLRPVHGLAVRSVRLVTDASGPPGAAGPATTTCT
ncbi:MAG: hypothetical protein M0026_00115 [Nocardiopsaceae bacterium]|nr:hypothetical protein [Nocardiopsaceae bacterium]